MNLIEQARIHWIEDRPRYAEFETVMASRIHAVVRERGIPAQISTRLKEVHSLVKKLLAKPHLNYENLPDKVGARVVVRYLHEVKSLEKLICENFAIEKVENTSSRLGVDRVGYQGIHLDGLALKEDDELQREFPAKEFFLELQLRTMSQNLWSEISHDSFYKNEALIEQQQTDLRRRICLMAGLVEVADREFERMSIEIPDDQAAIVFRTLEPLYYSLTSEQPNVELSMEVIRLLLPLYGRDTQIDEILRKIRSRYQGSQNMFRTVYSNPDNLKTDTAALLFQPEAMMIYDCLLADRDQTLKCWNEKFSDKELERVASLFGISLI